MLTPPEAPTDEPGQQPAPGKGLVSNAGALLANRLLQAVLGWSGTVLIARTLSIDDFGQFTLIFTVLGLMSIVTDMGIGRLAVRGMLGDPDHDPEDFAGAYVVLRSLLGLLGYGVALLVVWLSGYPSDLVAAMAVAGLVVVLATPSAALDVVFQSRMRLGSVGLIESAGMFAQVALTAALAAAGGSLLLFTIPAVLFEVVVLAWKWPLAHRMVAIRLRVDWPLWRNLLREALPLSIGFGLATVYTRVDAVMLSQLADFEAVGIYGVSYKFIDVVHFISTAVTAPLLTLLVAAWPHDHGAFREAARKAAMLLALGGGLALTGLLAFAGPVTSLLYGADYAPGADTTRVLALAEMLTFATALAMSCLVAADRHRVYPWVMAGGLLLNVGLNLVLIPQLSYLGAGLATLTSNVLVTALMWWVLLRVPGMRPLGLGRAALAVPACALGVGAGLGADQVMPWVPAAALGCLVYVGAAVVLGLTRAAGVHRGARA